MQLPSHVKQRIGNRPYTIDQVGKSGSRILCFDDMVLKIERQREEADAERTMMAWLSGKLPVPRILTAETVNGTNYLLMSRVKGEMACAPSQLEQPHELVKRLAEGLRMLWNVSPAGCPRQNTINQKLRLAEHRVRDHLCGLEDVEPGTYGPNGFRGPEDLLAWLQKNRPEEELVFSHGDYCLPNVMVRGGRVSGLIDLGRSGVADRYQDIALCYRSLRDNLNGVYGGKTYSGFSASRLFDELGIPPDWDKIRYYLLLDELF